MKKLSVIFVLLLVISLVGCKKDAKDVKDAQSTTNKKEVVKKERKPLTEEQKLNVQSVMSKVMLTPETKTVSSYIVSAELVETFMNAKGPFTVFAPSNDAFSKLKNEQTRSLLNPENKENLIKLLKSHVVKGNLDSSELVKKMNDAGGKITLTTLAETTITISKKGNDIQIVDTNGTSSTVGKSDILASNGVVHIIDTPLSAN